MSVPRIVLAYSGGLETSVAIRWLAETRQAEVVTVTLDLGRGPDLEGELEDVRDRALGHRFHAAQRPHFEPIPTTGGQREVGGKTAAVSARGDFLPARRQRQMCIRDSWCSIRRSTGRWRSGKRRWRAKSCSAANARRAR